MIKDKYRFENILEQLKAVKVGSDEIGFPIYNIQYNDELDKRITYNYAEKIKADLDEVHIMSKAFVMYKEIMNVLEKSDINYLFSHFNSNDIEFENKLAEMLLAVENLKFLMMAINRGEGLEETKTIFERVIEENQNYPIDK